ncbi:hypothetical protein R6Q59_029657 [Mikania micrantha]
MRDCMVVATLIVTVAFAAAFTIPGGYKADNGLPLFIHQRTFLVFVIADAISLFSSSTSILVFLSILTSRQEQHDFIHASFFVLYNKGLKWVPIVIAAFATVPVVFAVLQFPLLVDVFRSMYDSHYLFKPKKRMLFFPKQKLSSGKSSCWRFPYIIQASLQGYFLKTVDVPLD